MSAAYPQTVCARVREQVSLELDGELSHLELRMLGTHLDRCARCAVYAADVRDVTERIRSAPHALMQRPVVVRRKGRSRPCGSRSESPPLSRSPHSGSGRSSQRRRRRVEARSPGSRGSRPSRRLGASSSRSRRSFASSRPGARFRRAAPSSESSGLRPMSAPRLLLVLLLSLCLVASACGGGEPSVEEFGDAVVLNRNRVDFVLGRITRAQSVEELLDADGRSGGRDRQGGGRARGHRCAVRLSARGRQSREVAPPALGRRPGDRRSGPHSRVRGRSSTGRGR